MIARKHRFHGYGSLRYVYQHGQTVRGPLCAIKYVVNPKRSDYRLAIVVSKKVSKSAVRRNRIRRRLFEVVRQEAEQFNQVYDLVITVFHEEVATMSSDDVRKMIRAQFKQGRLV